LFTVVLFIVRVVRSEDQGEGVTPPEEEEEKPHEEGERRGEGESSVRTRARALPPLRKKKRNLREKREEATKSSEG
jgi:hypothetical protein